MTNEEELTDEFRRQMTMARYMVDMVRDMAKWTRREYTILFLGIFIGIGLISMGLWLWQYYLLLVQLGVLP